MWAEMITQWIASKRAKGNAEGTVRLQRLYVQRVARMHDDPAEVSGTDLVTFFAEQCWQPETRRAARLAMRSFFGWAVEAGHLDDNPAAALHAVRLPRREPRVVPEKVLQKALERAEPETRLMLLLGGYAGLRRAEIASLRHEHADLRAGVLSITGKGRDQRLVPVHPRLRLAWPSDGEGWVFPSPARPGRHVSVDYVDDRVKEALDGWSCHRLRTRFGTVVYSETRDLVAAQALMGHASPTTTRRYIRQDIGHLRAVVERIS